MEEIKPKFRMIPQEEPPRGTVVETPVVQDTENIYKKTTIDQLLNPEHPKLKFQEDRIKEVEPQPPPPAPIRLPGVPDDVNVMREALEGPIRPIMVIVILFDIALLLSLLQPFEAVQASWSLLSKFSILLCLTTLLSCIVLRSRARSKDIPASVRANKTRMKYMAFFLLMTVLIAWIGYRPGDTASPQEHIEKFNFFKWVLKTNAPEED